jgi:hypothetical protein
MAPVDSAAGGAARRHAVVQTRRTLGRRDRVRSRRPPCPARPRHVIVNYTLRPRRGIAGEDGPEQERCWQIDWRPGGDRRRPVSARVGWTGRPGALKSPRRPRRSAVTLYRGVASVPASRSRAISTAPDEWRYAVPRRRNRSVRPGDRTEDIWSVPLTNRDGTRGKVQADISRPEVVSGGQPRRGRDNDEGGTRAGRGEPFNV